MHAVLLLLILTGSTLVLRSGDRIALEGQPREENGVVTFRAGGALYSVRVEEIDVDATRAASDEPARTSDQQYERLPLRTDPEKTRQLIAELEKNHAGTPPSPQRMLEPQPGPTAAETAAMTRDENAWRQRARAQDEAIRRAFEDLELIESEIEALEQKIRTLFTLGYTPRHFTYDTTRLERLRERLPYARLAVERAQRSYDQFREDARRQGILPGWLR